MTSRQPLDLSWAILELISFVGGIAKGTKLCMIPQTFNASLKIPRVGADHFNTHTYLRGVAGHIWTGTWVHSANSSLASHCRVLLAYMSASRRRPERDTETRLAPLNLNSCALSMAFHCYRIGRESVTNIVKLWGRHFLLRTLRALTCRNQDRPCEVIALCNLTKLPLARATALML